MAPSYIKISVRSGSRTLGQVFWIRIIENQNLDFVMQF
jgi:hypothetical protein